MRLKPMSVAVACAIFVVSSAMLASPERTQTPGQVTQTPGQMTQARVWIQNRSRGEAVPVTLQESALDAPLSVRVTNAQGNSGVDDPVYVRVVRQPRVWLYQTVTVKPDENLATALSAAGVAGWETTGIALPAAEGTTILMKRLR
jgi:hypothetical protein